MNQQAETVNPAIYEQLAEKSAALRSEIERVVIGQRRIIDPLLVCLLCQGHALIVGVPGLAKTLLVRTLARGLGLGFRRIQFTPDMMPSDILGTELIQEDHATGERTIRFLKGPVFSQLILADEINRTPPRTQAALLEAMAERQVTVGGNTMGLQPPFVVVATQNPIEQEGTYPLPEAQLDRFMLSLWMDYPEVEDEVRIVSETRRIQTEQVTQVCQGDELIAFTEAVWKMPVSEHVVRFAVELARRTRPRTPGASAVATRYFDWGAGPRAAQYLIHASRALAAMDGRPAPGCDDVRAIAPSVLRHRVILNYAATGEGLTTEMLLDRIIEQTPEPAYD
ncbi:MAG: MoxR family ATPase [Phycisphaeraceae bacterium]|nr:MoxR family ATPase [Phycisphaeraceae bacterium]